MKVGDRVKVGDSVYAHTKNLLGRYGYVADVRHEQDAFGDPATVVLVAFNDFETYIPIQYLKQAPWSFLESKHYGQSTKQVS